MKVKTIIIIISAFTFSSAQRLIDRNINFNPLLNKDYKCTDEEFCWINSIGGWGEFGGYRIIRDNDHAWLQKLGAYIEFFRNKNDLSLAFISSIEFIADPHNDIRFNPRAIFWGEGFLFSYKSREDFWQFGYFHRCKHDIDNLNYGKERSLIYGSLLTKYFYNLDQNSFFIIGLDIYTILQDARIYSGSQSIKENDAGNLKKLAGSLSIKYLAPNLSLDENFSIYFNSYLNGNFFSNSTSFFKRISNFSRLKFNYGASAGLEIRGRAKLRIGINYGYFDDTGIDTTPQSSHLISFVVRISDFSYL